MHPPPSRIDPGAHAAVPAEQNVFELQFMQDVAPDRLLYFPKGHKMQSVEFPVLVEGLYFPGGQFKHSPVLFTLNAEPSGQAYFPAAQAALQALQSVSTPRGSAAGFVYKLKLWFWYRPAGQSWHLVAVPFVAWFGLLGQYSPLLRAHAKPSRVLAQEKA